MKHSLTFSRRKFFQMGAAALGIRNHSTSVGKILEGASEVGKGIHPIFSQIPGFPTELDGSFSFMYHKYFSRASLNSILDEQLPSLKGDSHEDIHLWLQKVYQIERLRIEEVFSPLLHKLPQSLIDSINTKDSPIWLNEDVLSEGLEEVGICSTDMAGFELWFENGSERGRTGISLRENGGEFILNCTHWIKKGEYYEHFMGGDIEKVCSFLSKGLENIGQITIKEHTKRIQRQRKLSKEVDDMIKQREDKELPAIQTEFQALMNKILAGEIEVTDEVRHKVWSCIF